MVCHLEFLRLWVSTEGRQCNEIIYVKDTKRCSSFNEVVQQVSGCQHIIHRAVNRLMGEIEMSSKR